MSLTIKWPARSSIQFLLIPFLYMYIHVFPLPFPLFLSLSLSLSLSLFLSLPLSLSVIELTGDTAPDSLLIERSDVIVTTPEKWDGISRSWQNRKYVKV